MHRFVVLLRGVNVGKGQRIAMADLRGLLQDLGGQDVATLLNSGNAVLSHAGRSPAALAASIAAELARRHAITTPVIVKTAAEVRRIIDQAPVTPEADEHSRFLVAFAADAAGLQTLAPLQSRATAEERLLITDQAAYLHCPVGLMGSRLAEAVLGPAGKAVTTRNWATLLKIADRLAN